MAGVLRRSHPGLRRRRSGAECCPRRHRPDTTDEPISSTGAPSWRSAGAAGAPRPRRDRACPPAAAPRSTMRLSGDTAATGDGAGARHRLHALHGATGALSAPWCIAIPTPTTFWSPHRCSIAAPEPTTPSAITATPWCMRLRPQPAMSFRDCSKHRDTATGAFAHQRVSLDRAVREFNPDRRHGAERMTRVSFGFREPDGGGFRPPGVESSATSCAATSPSCRWVSWSSSTTPARWLRPNTWWRSSNPPWCARCSITSPCCSTTPSPDPTSRWPGWR